MCSVRLIFRRIFTHPSHYTHTHSSVRFLQHFAIAIVAISSKMYTKKAANTVIFAFSLSYILACSCALSSEKIGINYGRLGNNLPSPYQTITLLNSMEAGHVKLYDANPEVLKLLSGTDLHVSIMVTNEQISGIAANQSKADLWVQENVVAYYPSTKIRFVLVGNEVFSYNDLKMWHDLVPAMRNIKRSLSIRDIHNVKVSTAIAMETLESSFPPSSGKFRSDIPGEVILPLLKFLNGTKSFLFLDVYTYFPWSLDPTNMNLDFALLKDGNETYQDPESCLIYKNLLDQMLDSVIFAMGKYGFDNILLAISETGWPHAGDIDQPGANAYNAATYNRNLVMKMTSNPPLGTPARPGIEILTFIFSLYDENQKPGPGTERHWGLLSNNGKPTYEVDLTGTRPETSYAILPKPSNNHPYKGKLWCVADSRASLTDLGPALDFACGQGNGTCNELAPGKGCYQPVSISAHASYAFSSYWAKFRNAGAVCYFDGLAVQTTTDPSHGSCQFPSVLL
ncbi:probable glucan endo-1,3-beta-glucosidase A6 [Sesamum indicum]|uniref:glucan endo-1,3-beta-D-glucosidase n=1 Tax=Sesamum indicum TaxID=4182 RepID=A0A6I9UPU8_SESIN|nr:probable glucan endo-1,3-beta-glucosidase A6 [Sesamum indicum]